MKRTTFVGLTAVAHLTLTAWIRRDAKKRDIDASPWDLLTLLTGVFGLLGYRRSRDA
ncbi:hypothetical protein [Halogeometricum borinquense]|uniref:hypothetical protein n=1 Tax=Halogeometricum borinquense TaxID=60847 RepID=UPI0013ECA411|nr:hypothetical protein [Halogeometricum borinquense]